MLLHVYRFTIRAVTRQRKPKAKAIMKPKIMWAIVDKKTGLLGEGKILYFTKPLLYEREEWAIAEVGKQGRVARVEIREVPS